MSGLAPERAALDGLVRPFAHLDAPARHTLFAVEPERLHRGSGRELLSLSLGATLYMPANRPVLAADVLRRAATGVTSIVVCLEDAVDDEGLSAAETNLVDALRVLHGAAVDLPLLFVRVRNPAQLVDLAGRLEEAADALHGFVLPKFTADTGPAWMGALDDVDHLRARPLSIMPVLESPAVLHIETRAGELARLRSMFDRHRERILAVRLGTTDLCALYGLRRAPDTIIYDVKVVADVVADVVNVLGRADGSGFTITGSVWEHYGVADLGRPSHHGGPAVRHGCRATAGLIREVQLDAANGLAGKTVIHPRHVAVVNALSVVSFEEYQDALDILSACRRSGVLASGHRNKMNEIRPHTTWARRTVLRSRVFGVARDGISFLDLLAADPPS